MNKGKIYISGAITELPLDEVRAKFGKAEKSLAEQGYETVSPLKNGIPYDSPYESHMMMNIILLSGCDAVYLLSGWIYSKGATLEKNIAKLTGKRIVYEREPVFTELKQVVSVAAGVPFYEIAGGGRERNKVYARMAYAHFCAEQAATVTDIAAEMRRSHSSVIYYLRKFDDDIKFNSQFRETVAKIKTALQRT